MIPACKPVAQRAGYLGCARSHSSGAHINASSLHHPCGLLRDRGAGLLLLSSHSNPHTYSGLAMLFYSLAAAPLAFERLVAPPCSAAGEVVGCALSLLGCGLDAARKTAASLLSAAVHVPAVMREFQQQVGAQAAHPGRISS